MTLSAGDIGKLRLSLATALAMIALGAAGARFAASAAYDARLAQAARQSERNEIGGRLQRVRSEESEIKRKAAQFNSLRERGVIGEERRLEWVELLKSISDRRRLIDVRYEIAPQRSLDAGSGDGAQTFYVSRMTLQARLLHEEDLTRLLGDLRQQASALIRIKRCTVVRLPRGDDDERNAQLQADCLIDWITLRAETDGGAKQ